MLVLCWLSESDLHTSCIGKVNSIARKKAKHERQFQGTVMNTLDWLKQFGKPKGRNTAKQGSLRFHLDNGRSVRKPSYAFRFVF